MGKFAKPATQASSVTKAMLRNGSIKSFGTARNYTQALTRVAEYVRENRLGSLRDLTPAQANDYLRERAEAIGQKQLDMERQATQAMMQHVTEKLAPEQRLSVIKSEYEQILSSRSYTPEQVNLIRDSQQIQNALATDIAYAAGLRAHELLTLLPATERAADCRPTTDTKFDGRVGERYTVEGKGRLVRDVQLPSQLAAQLEARRLDHCRTVTDRNIHYRQYYDINGGQRWNSSFSQASNRVLGWSSGAHGLRHSYAQERMHELQCQGLPRQDALQTVSKELGHFRPDITEVYLR